MLTASYYVPGKINILVNIQMNRMSVLSSFDTFRLTNELIVHKYFIILHILTNILSL